MTDKHYISIGDCARQSGVSIRTLHYYEEIGLLVPERRSNGYRVYGPNDLLRLQQILIQKSMGFPLETIRAGLDAPDFDYLSQLQDQKRHLSQMIQTHQAQLDSIEAAISQIEIKETKMNYKVLFKGFDPNAYEEEVKSRWGDMPAYAQSRKRTKNYSDKDWAEMKSEEIAIWQDAAKAMTSGADPMGATARDLAHRHREHISRWFYDCSPDMHKRLSEMWLADTRFQKTIDAHGVGLTDWMVEVVRACE